MTVSIKDIAREAGVSHSTVSRALSNSDLVNTRTKERIQRLAREMGYSPDAQARSLVMGRTQTLGLVVTTITDPFIAEVVQVIERTALDHGYSVVLTSSNAEPAREIAAVEMLHSKRVDAVIVTSSRIGALYQDHLDRLGVPVVLINSHSEQSGPYTFSVTVDNQHGACLATQHLVACGHQRIAYVTGPADHSDDLTRMAGYQAALEQAGLDADPGLIVRGTGRADGGERALGVILGLEKRPTAALCYNDMTAIGLMRAAHTRGVSIPQDLAVVGFDDVPFASYVRPMLTTVAQPIPEMGRCATEMALDLMVQEDMTQERATKVVLPGRLVIRGSCGAVLRQEQMELIPTEAAR